MLNVVVRARFVARLFAAINYVTSRRERTQLLCRIRKEREETYSRGHNEEGINNIHKAAKRAERNAVALNGESTRRIIERFN